LANPSAAIVRQLTGFSALLARAKPQAPSEMANYFGPGLEVTPIAPPGTEARGWQYWVNQNMVFTPRPDAALTAQQLRSLAQYPLARTAIENCKDVITSLPRQIRAKKKPGEKTADVDKRSRGDQTLKMLNQFFDCPDGEHDWDSWLRPWIEDLYVLDAPAVLIRRMKSGKISQARWIDGAFITRLINEYGYTPQPPLPAYQQLWSGTPATVGGIPFVDLTTDQLLYRPRNIVPRNTVSSFLYGYSPTEQIAQEIEIGQQRLNFVLSYYTTGTIPDAMHIVPPNISSDQLNAAQKALTAEMSGQPWKRSGFIKLIQGFVDRTQPGSAGGDQLIFPKEKLLGDPFDELHIRKVFYAYGASTQRIMKQMNRASAQTNQEASEEEGTMPFANSAKAMVDWMIAVSFRLGFGEYELTYDAQKELDVVKRSTADKNDVDAGIITRDEARQLRGLDEMGGNASTLMVTTSTGLLPVEMAADQAQAQLDSAQAGADSARQMADNPPEPDSGKPGDSKKKVGKRHIPHIDPARHTPDTRQAQSRLENALLRVFQRQKDKVHAALRRLLKADAKEWKAGEWYKPSALRLLKADEKDADDIWREIQKEFEDLPVEARAALEQAAFSGVAAGMTQIEITSAGLLSSLNTIAADYARERAAELVGMKYNVNGELVENPNAEWAISDTTRDRIRTIITDSFEEKTAFDQVITRIDESGIFSESRAAMIARTEIAQAQVAANFNVWKQSGLVRRVKWLAVGPNPCPICLDNNDEVRPLGEEFPSGDRYPTAHPNCYCILQAVEFNEGAEKGWVTIEGRHVYIDSTGTSYHEAGEKEPEKKPEPKEHPEFPPTKPTIAHGPTAFLIKQQLEESIPAEHQDLLIGIDFREGQLIHAQTTIGLIDALGLYHSQYRTITLSSNAKNIEVIGGGTVLHEMGHHVHIAKMTDEAAEQWNVISQGGSRAMISAYARTNQGEHFAEAYRAYAQGGGKRAALKNLEPASYKFVQSVFRKNSPKLLPNGQMNVRNFWGRYSKEPT
jgi:hypothetical protein